MADGSIVFTTALDNRQLEKDLKQAEDDIDELKRKISEKEAERNAIVEEMVAVKRAIEEAKEQQLEFDELLDRGVALSKRYYETQGEIDGYNLKLKETTALQKKLGAGYAEVYRQGGNVFTGAIQGVESRFSDFTNKVNKRLKKLFVFSFVFGALSTLKKYLVGVVGEDERLNNSVQNLLATLRGVVAPLVSVLIPALTVIVNVLNAMIITLARLVDMVFKTDFIGSINQAREAAMASDQAAEATDNQADATNKLAKAQKKAAKWLAAFDELNTIQADSSQDAADALDSRANEIPTAETPTWDGVDTSKIDAKLSEIMIILGAALLAVGAILAFSGINIPLGLTLMAVGALMVYTAAQENWEKLPQEVRDAINTALIITGIVLIVLGAVLAFSGAQIALGIGMMIAGVVMLYTAAALNWEELPEEVKRTITGIMVTLGTALLTIGAILALSGANIPLGVGLMIAGALSLAAAATLNWDELSDEVKEEVATIAAVLSVAFLAIGGILAFSGANIPLGIALMAIGAATLVAEAVIAWNTMPDNIRDTLSKILAIVGAFLLVIGIVLCLTGVAIPIGIALILAGVVSLVSAAAINWNFLKDKAKEIWHGITSWFNQNVAPIFTAQWWEEKFKSIANGLIDALNGGLEAADNFVNGLLGGLSDIAATFGIDIGFQPTPSMRIPHLAQGAVIPPNREFLAVLGDQRSGTNIETPESLMRQVFREEMASALMQMSSMQGGDVTMVLRVGNEELARAVNQGNASLARRGQIQPMLGL